MPCGKRSGRQAPAPPVGGETIPQSPAATASFTQRKETFPHFYEKRPLLWARNLHLHNKKMTNREKLFVIFVPPIFWVVEHRGLEPLTPTLPVWCAPSCANAPKWNNMKIYYHRFGEYATKT